METQPETADTRKTNITIFVNMGGTEITIGAIEKLNIITEGHQTIKGMMWRVRFDKLRLGETFSQGFLHAKAQIYPLHIEIEGKDMLKTKICNVWIMEISETYQTAGWVIVDEMSFEAESIEVVAEKSINY